MLGNSKGGNKGKKYFIRKNATEDMITVESQTSANNFVSWFVNVCLSIQREIKQKTNGKIDEDIFNDTYLKMHEIILYTNLQIKDHRGYFMRAYYTNITQKAILETRCVAFDMTMIETPPSEANIIAFEQEYKEVVNKVFNEARQFLSYSEYDIFHGFIKWKEKQEGKAGGSIEDYSRIVKVKPCVIQRVFSKGRKHLSANKHLQESLNQLYSLI